MFYIGISLMNSDRASVWSADGRKVFTGTRAECQEFKDLLTKDK